MEIAGYLSSGDWTQQQQPLLQFIHTQVNFLMLHLYEPFLFVFTQQPVEIEIETNYPTVAPSGFSISCAQSL